MKRRVLPMVAAGLLALVLCACQKESLPIPEHPLKLDTVERELAEWRADCTVTAEPAVTRYGMEMSTFRVFRAETETLFCTIDSGLRNGQRMLSIALRLDDPKNAPSPEECEGMLAFAASLLGGFEQAGSVYEAFAAEYDTTNTGRIKADIKHGDNRTTPGSTARWGRLVDGIACQVVLVQPDRGVPQEFIRQVILCTDWDEFFPERTLR